MNMGDTKESHEERTAHEPREASLHLVILSEVKLVGSLIRLLKLRVPPGEPNIQFLPGQWVDTFCPGIAKAGGFTITSTPSKAASASSGSPDRYIELAVKQSPDNPVAAWLWQDQEVILGQTLQVRVGGSFVFPPPKAPALFVQDRTARLVFVAGGVGINPLISMVSHLGELNAKNESDNDEEGAGPEVVFLYSIQAEHKPIKSGSDGGEEEDEDDNIGKRILFLRRLASLFSRGAVRGQLKVFLTGSDDSRDGCDGGDGTLSCNEEDVPCARRRITTADLDAAVRGGGGNGGLENIYVYVCGVPTMTDAFVAHLTKEDVLGLPSHQVLLEKWW